MKKLFPALQLIACLSACQVERVDIKDFRKTQSQVQQLSTDVGVIAKQGKELSQDLKDVGTKVNGISSYVGDVKKYFDSQVANLKETSRLLEEGGKTLAVGNETIDESVKSIATESKKIEKNLTTVPESTEKNNIDQANKIIQQQAATINEMNIKNKGAELAIAEADKRVKQAEEQAQKERIRAEQAQKLAQDAQAEIAKAQGTADLISDEQDQAKADADEAKASAQKNADDQEKLNNANKALKDENNKFLYKILYGFFAAGLQAIIGGVVCLQTGTFIPRVGISAIAGGILTVQIAGATIRWLPELQVIGLVILGLVVLGTIGYFVWHSIVMHRGVSELVEQTEKTKQYLTEEAKSALYKGEHNISDLVQSNSTKLLVKAVRGKIDKLNIKQKIKDIKAKI